MFRLRDAFNDNESGDGVEDQVFNAAIPACGGLCLPPPQGYKETLQTQVLESAGEQLRSVKFGANLSEGKLGNFQEDQMGQLYELMLESTKPNRQFDIQGDNK